MKNLSSISSPAALLLTMLLVPGAIYAQSEGPASRGSPQEQATAALPQATGGAQAPAIPSAGDLKKPPGASGEAPYSDLLAQSRRALIQGKQRDALALAQRALTAAGAEHGEKSSEAGTAMREIGTAYRALTQYVLAIEWDRKALALHLQLLGADHPETIESQRSLGNSLFRGGKAEEGLQTLLSSLEALERSQGRDDARQATLLSELTVAYRVAGQLDAAATFGKRAVEGTRRARGDDHIDTASAQMALGNVLVALARFDEALPMMEAALATFERRMGRDHPDTARALSNVSTLYSRLGQHDKAVVLRQRAVAIAERTLGPQHVDLAVHLNNLSLTYAALEQWTLALPLQKRVLALREQLMAPDHPQVALALNNLSHLHGRVGDYAAALPLQLRALAIRQKVLGDGHHETASSHHNLAVVYRGLGQLDEAMRQEERALSGYEAALGTQHPQTALVRAGLAELHSRRGDLPLAIALLKQTVNVQQAMREQAARIDAAALRSYTASVSNFYQQLASALSDEGRLPEAQLVLDMLKEEEQFEFVRRQPGTAPGSTRLGFNAAEQAWAERYRQISGRLAALGAEQQALERTSRAPGATLTPEQRQRRQTLAADLAVARTAFESFLKDMRADFAAKGAARTVELTEAGTQALQALRALLQGLGSDSVLLQLYLTEDRVHFLLTTPGVQLARSVSVSATELNRQIGQFRRLLRDPRSDPLPAAQALYRLLIAPVAQDLEQAGARTVMLSLDGALRYLPFGALHDGQRYLLQRWNLPIYTSVTRDRLRDAVTPAWRAAGLGVTRQIGSFDALPGVRAEMSRIIQQPGTAPATPAAMPGEVHLDEQFTARKLMEVSRAGFSVMHLASHFRFSPGTEANSFLLLGDGQQLTLGEMRQQNLRFDQTELLTLSACETGLGGGRDERGQEIEGFGVLAQQQGARAVLATLWAVADQSTAALMAETYRQREAQRLSKIEALRQAQLALQRESAYAHPFYWAPFILMGNWK